MFDLGNRKSFNDVQRWKKDLDEKVRVKGKSIPCLLLGNKVSDMSLLQSCSLQGNVCRVIVQTDVPRKRRSIR